MHPLIASLINAPAIPLAVALVVLVLYVLYLDHKIVTLTRGESGASLENIIKSCITSAERIRAQNEAIVNHAATLEKKISHAVRNAQTIRYKAYEANGSNQSFSVALVNEQGNGVVITSLHSHDRMSTFAKPIEQYKSTYELTEEELGVLARAKEEHQMVIGN